jgi:transcriptional regulator with XRE-family HTH domain
MTLRAAREWRKWTQEQLEAESGVAQAHISKIERGDIASPSNDTVTKLELALRVNRGTLVFGQVMAEKAS